MRNFKPIRLVDFSSLQKKHRVLVLTCVFKLLLKTPRPMCIKKKFGFVIIVDHDKSKKLLYENFLFSNFNTFWDK